MSVTVQAVTVIFTVNDLRPFSKIKSEGGKGNIHRLIILNRKKKGRETMGTMHDSDQRECGAVWKRSWFYYLPESQTTSHRRNSLAMLSWESH